MYSRCALCHVKFPTPLEIVKHIMETHPDMLISILWPSYDVEKGRVKYKMKHYGIPVCDIEDIYSIIIDGERLMLKKNKRSKTSSEDITNDKVRRNDRLEEESFVPYKDLIPIINRIKQLLPAVVKEMDKCGRLGEWIAFFEHVLRLP